MPNDTRTPPKPGTLTPHTEPRKRDPLQPKRADAKRNQARILAAAVEIFTKHGPDTSTEKVAELAEVGIGTIFRHFPTKQLLLRAVADHVLEELGVRLSEAIASDSPGIIPVLIEVVTSDRILSGLLGAGDDLDLFDKWRSLIEGLLTRDQRQGVIREDVDVDCILNLLKGLCHITRLTDSAASVRATVTVTVDGLCLRSGA